MHYYQFNIGDYFSHTRHLSIIEDLAYRRLLDNYYLHEKPFNPCFETVSRLIGLKEYVTEVEQVIKEYFVLTELGWVNPRADSEISKYKEFISAGKRGADKRWNSPPIAPLLPDYSPPNAGLIATNNHKPITNNHKPNINTITSNEVIYQTKFDEKIEKKKKVKVQHPDCPHQAVIDLFHKTLPTLPKIEIWHSNRQTSLRSRWREVCVDHAKDGLEVSEESILKWFEDYFIYIGKSKFLIGQIQQKNRQPFCATLEWLLKPASFTKVVEGQYHKE